MKKVLVLVAALALVSTSAFALISNSDHDFSTRGWGSNQICIYCHTPHGGQTGVALSPLWNRNNSTATYVPYTGVDMNDTTISLGSMSTTCLSCHDGTVALDSFGGVSGTNYIATGVATGTDMSNDHPVGVLMNGSSDAEIRNAPTLATVKMFNDQVECASCHDVHNTSGVSPLLATSNSASALCLACHIK